MLTRILTVVLFLTIMGLLVVQRFLSMPPEVPVVVVDIFGESNLSIGEELQRGKIINSDTGYIKFTIANMMSLWLAPNTQVELQRLFEDELVVRFTKGRILVDHEGDVPLRIETNNTSHLVLGDIVTFVNYDFLETIHVIPLSGSVQVSVDSTGEQLLTPVPLSIHETEPVTFEKLEVNLAAGDVADFYRWAGILSAEAFDFNR